METAVVDKNRIIGIVGTRSRDTVSDYNLCYKAFKEIYQTGDIIVSGGCPKGGDRFANVIAKKLGLTIITHYPDWDGVGKSAGFARNGKIAKDADILIAVVAKDRKGGTEDTITKAQKLGKEVVLVE